MSESVIVQIIRNNECNKLEEYLNGVSDHSMLIRATYSIQSRNNRFVQPIIPNNNLTLLHIAAIFDSLECYILLLKQEGFTTRTLSADSYTPFHYACFNASYEVVMYTLSIDPAIPIFDPDGANHQYLYLTVIGGDPKILEQLFKLKVDINSLKNRRDDVFTKCISCRSIECLKILLEHVKNTKYSEFGDTTMQMKAIINNQPEALRLLVNNVDDIKFINSLGESVFSLACFYGIGFKSVIIDMLRMLHKSVCIEPPKATRCKGVCHWICTLCDLDVAREMLKTPGIDINRLDNMGRPGIFQLIDKDKNEKETQNIIKLIQLLIENGFNINVRAPKENNMYKTESVLEKFTACIKPNMAIIQYLISCGADIYALKKGKNQKLIDAILQTRNSQLKEIFRKQKDENEGK